MEAFQFNCSPTASQSHHERCIPVPQRNRTLSPSKDFSSNLKGQSKTRSTEASLHRHSISVARQYCAIPSVKVTKYLQNLSKNSWRTLKVAPFMLFLSLSITYHHYHLIRSWVSADMVCTSTRRTAAKPSYVRQAAVSHGSCPAQALEAAPCCASPAMFATEGPLH